MKFLVDVAKPKKVILIGHDDCLWYKDFRFSLDRHDTREKTIHDLKGVKAGVESRFQLRAEAYFARLDGGQVVFEAVG